MKVISRIANDIRRALGQPPEHRPREWRVSPVELATLIFEMHEHRRAVGVPVISMNDERPNVLILGIPVFAR